MMIRKINSRAIVLLSLFILISISSCKDMKGGESGELTADTVAIEKAPELKPGEIAFKELQGFYFRSGQKTRDTLQFIHVKDSSEFYAWFNGGDQSFETQEALNFDKNYIIAVVTEPKKIATNIILSKCYTHMNKLRMEFDVSEGLVTEEKTRSLYIVSIAKPGTALDGLHCYVNDRSRIFFALPKTQ